jgi:hypothetical protein
MDPSGNVPPGFASATFAVMFRSLTTLQHVEGQGAFTGANASTGIVVYSLDPNDFAAAYAIASPAMLPGKEIFEILAECTANGLRYDAAPDKIQIRKV